MTWNSPISESGLYSLSSGNTVVLTHNIDILQETHYLPPTETQSKLKTKIE